MLCCQSVRPSSNIKKDDQPQYIPHIRKMLQHVMDDAKDGSMLLRGFCMPKVGPGTRATRRAYEVPDSGGALVCLLPPPGRRALRRSYLSSSKVSWWAAPKPASRPRSVLVRLHARLAWEQPGRRC